MLTDTQIKSFKPASSLYRETDSHGLMIEIATSGSKIWRHRYRFEGKPTMATLGYYPEVSLLTARQKRDANKQLLKQGINPKDHNKLPTSDAHPTFKEMFYRWHEEKIEAWSHDYANDVLQRAECYLFPYIGSKPINRITPPEVLRLLKQIEEKGVLDTLQKIKSIANRVFSYSVAMGYAEINPVRDLSNDAFKTKPQKHYATLTNPKDIAWLLRTLDHHKGSYHVCLALKLAPYLMLRPSELTKLSWSEVDFDSELIRIKAERMKMRKTHLVPLCPQTKKILTELSQIDTGSPFIFPSPRNRNTGITTNSLLSALRNLGIDKDTFTTHGFRHMASTRLNEMGFRDDVIERQLAHRDTNKVRAIYNHAEHLDERKVMMCKWADYLDNLKAASP